MAIDDCLDNFSDVIDSRYVIERIESVSKELEGELSVTDRHLLEGELADLKLLAEQGETMDNWEHGLTLIRDSYFKEYAQELAEDIGAMPKEYSWPTSCIDWDQAADELRMDYTPLTFGNVTYWAR